MRLRSGIATVLLTTALAGCSGGGPSAEQAGEALATGLAKLDLTGIRMSADHAQAELERITADLTGEDGAGRPEVSLADVAEDGDTATATLAWRWNLDGHDWAYRTTAELTRVEDAWSARWSPTLVEPSLAAGEVLEASSEQATRGDILGRDGRPIVTLRPVVRFGLDKMRVPNGREAGGGFVWPAR